MQLRLEQNEPTAWSARPLVERRPQRTVEVAGRARMRSSRSRRETKVTVDEFGDLVFGCIEHVLVGRAPLLIAGIGHTRSVPADYDLARRIFAPTALSFFSIASYPR